MTQWDLPHIQKQYAKRLKKIPPLEKGNHMTAMNEMFDIFAANWATTCTHMVGSGLWQMPLPWGWRLLGNGNNAHTVIGPGDASAAEWIENPLLPDIYKGFWRDKRDL